MTDPVILGNSGHIYQWSSIASWLELKPKINPLTNLEVDNCYLLENITLRDEILGLIESYKPQTKISLIKDSLFTPPSTFSDSDVGDVKEQRVIWKVVI